MGKVEKKSEVDEILDFFTGSGLTIKDWEEIQKEREESER